MTGRVAVKAPSSPRRRPGGEEAQGLPSAPAGLSGEVASLRRSAACVVAGTGEAVVNGEPVPVKAETLLLIGRGEAHESKNTGEGPLRTLNVYVPPASTEEGKG